MTATPASLPPGYERFRVGHATVVARREWGDAFRTVLENATAGGPATLHGWAERQPDRRTLVGRGVAYAVALPGRHERVVVRHNHHGGALARLTGDLFLPPTRAAHEVQVAWRLRAAGVPTPLVAGYVVYPGPPPFVRVDVASVEVAESRDLAQVLTQEGHADRVAALAATARLVAALSNAHARHHDLNVKNVLLPRDRGDALVLDVDRVEFRAAPARTVLDENLARLLRSARKWRERWGATVDEGELAALVERARSLLP